MKLGVDSFSLRWQGWDAFQILEYAAAQGLDNVHFSERRFFTSLEEDYLKALRKKAEELRLTIEVGMLSFDKYAGAFDASLGTGEEQLATMARAAKVVGSKVVRCVLGFQADRLGATPFVQHIEECGRALRAAGPVARECGIRFAIENHGGVDLLARELKGLIEAAGTDIAGACLDTGNPTYGGEDPVLSASVLGPLIISSHVRDSRVWRVADGAMAQWVPMGQGDVDMKRVVEIMGREAPEAPVDLEIITGGGPKHIPYLDRESDYWKLYPDMPAPDFARFVALAEKGTERPLEQLVMQRGPGVQPDEALKAQQRRHFEESVAYSTRELGLGERG